MAEELEIKLTLLEADLKRAASWLLEQPQARRGGVKTLVNRYYDTPDAELNHRRAALRVRQAGERFIQTLKTQGDFVNGAHRRQEWEWPLSSADLDLQLLAETPLGDDVDLANLQLAFETNFERQVIMINDGETVIEVAIDQGQVISRDHVRPLNELELELKAGDAGALIRWATKLAAEVPVFLNLVSKAEQGYYLAGMHRPSLEGQASPISVNEFLHGLSLCWLTGASYPVQSLDLSSVASTAKTIGVDAEFDEVVAYLKTNKPVEGLLASCALGQLQTALVAV